MQQMSSNGQSRPFMAWSMRIGRDDACVARTVLAATAIWMSLLAASIAAGADESHLAEAAPEELWASSAHANTDAKAFHYWDNSNPPAIPVTCAKCHSTPGYMDFLGADGTEAGQVDVPAEVGTTIDCMACHNDVTPTLSSATFPSGVTLNDLGPEARCITCHQGRESKVSVDTLISTAGLTDPNQADTVSTSLRFLNIHYMGAAATQFGAATKGGYQYEGKSYDIKFAHVKGMETCIDCHDQHSLEVRIETCVACHPGVQNFEDLRDIRMAGSMPDYDGDGDVLEGIYGEIQGLQAILYEAIQAYARDLEAPIIYDSHANPYFFKDIDGNGQVDPNEAVSANRYTAWTPRLLRAAFNYQVVQKDHGAYAHNGKYIIQLLFDSIEDLAPDRAKTLTRNDAGHFAGSEKPWRNWDSGGQVPATCSKCHSAEGLPLLAKEGTTATQPVANAMQCSTCHDAMPEFTRYQVASVKFPSGAELDTGNKNSNLCLNCHQGRASTVSVADAIADLDLDTVSSKLRFINVHYFPAGATLFGTQAKGMYEYEGKTYLGRFKHISSYDTCTECHNSHGLDVKTQSCMTAYCHGAAGKPQNIRKTQKDFDGDGNRTEGLAGEIETLAQALLDAMTAYAKDVVGKPIAYDSHAHPYFYSDDNGNGQVDAGGIRFQRTFAIQARPRARPRPRGPLRVRPPGRGRRAQEVFRFGPIAWHGQEGDTPHRRRRHATGPPRRAARGQVRREAPLLSRALSSATARSRIPGSLLLVQATVRGPRHPHGGIVSLSHHAIGPKRKTSGVWGQRPQEASKYAKAG
jgi:hypothetical protein